jgi:hypothetical protein
VKLSEKVLSSVLLVELALLNARRPFLVLRRCAQARCSRICGGLDETPP